MPENRTPKQEIAEVLRAAKRVVIVSHQGPDADAVGSLLALTRVLKALGKEVRPILADPLAPLDWLPGSAEVENAYQGGRALRVEVRATKDQIEALRYETESDHLAIIIEPKGEPISADAVRVGGGTADYDVLVVLDTPSWSYIGEVGLEHSTERPLLVIDHHPSNEKFGTLNWVDPQAASTSEMLISLIESLGVERIDPEVATCLYAGLVGDTGGFQNANTKSKTFSVAAGLVSAGANHRQIVEKLLQPSLDPAHLRIWGAALANLRSEPETGLAWSQLSHADLLEAGKPEHWGSSTLMNTLLRRVDSARTVLLLVETEPGVIQASLRVPFTAQDKPDLAVFATRHGGGGHREAAGFRLQETSLAEAIETVLPSLREYLKVGGVREAPAEPTPLEVSERDQPLPVSDAERTVPQSGQPQVGVWQANDRS